MIKNMIITILFITCLMLGSNGEMVEKSFNTLTFNYDNKESLILCEKIKPYPRCLKYNKDLTEDYNVMDKLMIPLNRLVGRIIS